jgi:alpha-methylacyl-CoA racemase
VFLDPFRPGVLEKLGLSPQFLQKKNPRLIVARLTGYRRTGAFSQVAGHDINYLAVAGVLSLLGRKGERPYAPSNLLADFAGGALPCFCGILLALITRTQTGRGQIVEANMVDGVQYLTTFPRLSMVLGVKGWDKARGENLLDGGAPFYDTYETKDGKYMAVGALESQFYANFVNGLGLELTKLPDRGSLSSPESRHWPELYKIFKMRFLEKTQDEWRTIFDDIDACVSPVLPLLEANEEIKPIVGLSETPSLDVTDRTIVPHDATSENVLEKWLGWKKGVDFIVDGTVVKRHNRLRL